MRRLFSPSAAREPPAAQGVAANSGKKAVRGRVRVGASPAPPRTPKLAASARSGLGADENNGLAVPRAVGGGGPSCSTDERDVAAAGSPPRALAERSPARNPPNDGWAVLSPANLARLDRQGSTRQARQWSPTSSSTYYTAAEEPSSPSSCASTIPSSPVVASLAVSPSPSPSRSPSRSSEATTSPEPSPIALVAPVVEPESEPEDEPEEEQPVAPPSRRCVVESESEPEDEPADEEEEEEQPVAPPSRRRVVESESEPEDEPADEEEEEEQPVAPPSRRRVVESESEPEPEPERRIVDSSPERDPVRRVVDFDDPESPPPVRRWIPLHDSSSSESEAELEVGADHWRPEPPVEPAAISVEARPAVEPPVAQQPNQPAGQQPDQPADQQQSEPVIELSDSDSDSDVDVVDSSSSCDSLDDFIVNDEEDEDDDAYVTSESEPESEPEPEQDDHHNPHQHCDPDGDDPVGNARQREALTQELFEQFNAAAFDGQLPADLPIAWSNRLRTTAGITRTRFAAGGRHAASVELSTKVLDTKRKLRQTLLHELCHAACWLVNGERQPPHGRRFWEWADRAMLAVPGVEVSRCHSYEIAYRFKWRCGRCGVVIGRHSNSIDVTKKACGRCHGRLEPLGTFNADGTPRRQRKPSAFAAYLKEHLAAYKRAHPQLTHKEVMLLVVEGYRSSSSGSGSGSGSGGAAGDGGAPGDGEE